LRENSILDFAHNYCLKTKKAIIMNSSMFFLIN
jgi:hypothetical protein